LATLAPPAHTGAMVVRLAIFLGLSLLLPSTALWAHPHVWADVRVDVTVNSGTIGGLWVAMTFDDIYSSIILADAAPGAKSLDTKAIEAIKNSYFKDLKFFDFFGHLFFGKKKLTVPNPEKFSASIDDKAKVTYQFYLPLTVKLEAGVPFAVSFYDDSYYIDMEYAYKDPVAFRSTGAGKASYVLKVVPQMSYYGGQATPSYALVTWNP
jgi:ABC-type uncharacterized transport system substrate-binding protein